RLVDGLAPAAVHGEVEGVRRQRRVVVADVVMHELEMPFAFAGLRVEGDEPLAEEIVAWTMPAVFVHQRHADGNVDQPELGVCGVRRPSVILPDAIAPDLRAPRPRLPAKPTRLSNQIELPPLLTPLDIESAYGAR